MAAITTAQTGSWDAATSWTGGVVPSLNDDVTVNHPLTPGTVESRGKTITLNAVYEFDTDIQVPPGGYIRIGPNGGLRRRNTTSPVQRRIYSASGSWTFRMDGAYPDSRAVDLGATRLENNIMSIWGEVSGSPKPYTGHLEFGADEKGDYWMGELGLPSCGAKLEDAQAEGQGQNFAHWVSGNVRNARFQLKFPKAQPVESADCGETLRRWCLSPYQVLVAGRYTTIKGHIESVGYNDTPGSRHHICTITVVEGRD